MPNILVATLGTWALIPEVVGFTNPGLVDLYRYHPHAENIVNSRNRNGIMSVEEVWVVTTGGDFAEGNLSNLVKWYELLSEKPDLPLMKIWRVTGIEDLRSQEDCRIMGEAIMRICLSASKAAGDGRCYHSLAGGRKTMSSDLQRAAFVFGSDGLLHVLQNMNSKAPKAGFKPKDLISPLSRKLKDHITPMVMGGCGRNPIVYVSDGASGAIRACDFPIPESIDIVVDFPVESDALTVEIGGRLSRSSFLLCNYSARINVEEKTPGFMAVYGLSPDLIRKLKSMHIGIDPARKEPEVAWLKKLPKAELHCHLGGIADAAEIIEIAEANLAAIDRHREILDPWLKVWQSNLDYGEFPHDLKTLRSQIPKVPEPLAVAAFILLFRETPEFLDRMLFKEFQREDTFVGVGFDPYERLGDLQGSALLQSEESIRAACTIMARSALAHNVRYLEARCSPAKYTRGGLSPATVAKVAASTFDRFAGLETGLLFIASRHGQIEEVDAHVKLAADMMDAPGSFAPLRGFDVAGSERTRNAASMREALLPLMERCLHLTIHAGETEPVESVWEAAYHLNAERIGHGLTLKENPALMDRFKDRGIAVEMCPSSNFQIVGFRDNYLQKTCHLPAYPLQEYLHSGLRVCIGTDNPGISRTDATNELHRAARLTPGGLSLWEILVLVRNGFKASFAERDLRHLLIRNAEREVLELLQEGELPHADA